MSSLIMAVGDAVQSVLSAQMTGFDLTIMIRNQLVEYYIKKEFEKSTQKVVQNRKKTVDRTNKR